MFTGYKYVNKLFTAVNKASPLADDWPLMLVFTFLKVNQLSVNHLSGKTTKHLLLF